MYNINNDLKKEILSYLPKRCLSCHQKMKNKIVKHNIKLYRSDEWRCTKNRFMPDVCNWCYYYVYEYP
jgi:hypothetical protein